MSRLSNNNSIHKNIKYPGYIVDNTSDILKPKIIPTNGFVCTLPRPIRDESEPDMIETIDYLQENISGFLKYPITWINVINNGDSFFTATILAAMGRNRYIHENNDEDISKGKQLRNKICKSYLEMKQENHGYDKGEVHGHYFKENIQYIKTTLKSLMYSAKYDTELKQNIGNDTGLLKGWDEHVELRLAVINDERCNDILPDKVNYDFTEIKKKILDKIQYEKDQMKGVEIVFDEIKKLDNEIYKQRKRYESFLYSLPLIKIQEHIIDSFTKDTSDEHNEIRKKLTRLNSPSDQKIIPDTIEKKIIPDTIEKK